MRRLLQVWVRRALRRLDPPVPLEVAVNRYRLINELADALVENANHIVDDKAWRDAQAALDDGDTFPAVDLLFRECSIEFDLLPAAPAGASDSEGVGDA